MSLVQNRDDEHRAARQAPPRHQSTSDKKQKMHNKAVEKSPGPVQRRMQSHRQDGHQQHGHRQRQLEHHRTPPGAQRPVIRIKRLTKHGLPRPAPFAFHTYTYPRDRQSTPVGPNRPDESSFRAGVCQKTGRVRRPGIDEPRDGPAAPRRRRIGDLGRSPTWPGKSGVTWPRRETRRPFSSAPERRSCRHP